LLMLRLPELHRTIAFHLQTFLHRCVDSKVIMEDGWQIPCFADL
jgi:hypothetical protein